MLIFWEWDQAGDDKRDIMQTATWSKLNVVYLYIHRNIFSHPDKYQRLNLKQ